MKVFALTACAVLLFAGLSAPASRATSIVSIVPAHPSAADSIRVTVQSGFTSLCWRDIGQTCTEPAPDTLLVSVQVQYCNGMPGCSCGELPTGYQRSCTFAPHPAGTYVVTFTEAHLNPADPLPTVSRSTPLTVTGSTPARLRSWGRLKSAYR